MTKISVAQYVECPFSAAMEYAEKAILEKKELYLTPAPAVAERARFTAATTADASDVSRGHDALLIAWQPRNQRLFPEFRGVLTARPKGRGVWLRLTGQYAPPYGIPGKIFDLLVGRIIARETMRHLLSELAGDIELNYRKEKLQHKTA